MKESLDILKVAELVIAAGYRSSLRVTPLKLQKMLYYIQAWYAVHMDKENVYGSELSEAWANGPVFKSVYQKYRHEDEIGMYTVISEPENSYEEIIQELDIDEEQKNLIETIISTYQDKSQEELVHLTHCEEPWINARGETPPFAKSSETISLDSMYNYYKKRIEK